MRHLPILIVSALPIVLAACSETPQGAGGSGGSTTSAGGGASTSSTSSTGGAGGTSSTTTTTTTTTTSGTGGSQAGTPITAPPEQWTWVPFDEAKCGNGSTTGIGVNLTQKSTRVLIYLQGGGACWDALTCFTLKTASNFTSGFDEADFATMMANTQGGFFDREDPENPVRDYSYVFVPYCTGDVHAGDNATSYNGAPAMHVGHRNMAAYLDRLVPTFPSPDRVILAGSSAGGYGAFLNWWQTQEAFGTTRVDLVDDSGTPMPADIPRPYEPLWRTAWNLAATLPPGCTTCDESLEGLLDFYATAYPDHRAALLSYTHDSVLPTYYGISGAQFDTGLQEVIDTEIIPIASRRYFLVDGHGHVLWGLPSISATSGGVTLKQFLTQMVTDDPAWASVHP